MSDDKRRGGGAPQGDDDVALVDHHASFNISPVRAETLKAVLEAPGRLGKLKRLRIRSVINWPRTGFWKKFDGSSRSGKVQKWSRCRRCRWLVELV